MMIGQTLKHYKIEKLIGAGGMGEVYLARDLRLNRPVALKILKPELMQDRNKRLRFFQEAKAASAVNYPSLAQIYDVDEADGIVFISMEYIEGKTVSRLITERELDLLASLEIAIQIAEGLSRAHETHIIHRDIKSENIMVTKDGHAKLLDFGLAKPLDPLWSGHNSDNPQEAARTETLPQTQAGVVMGTIAYMSPEQARGLPLDKRSDIFSLGIVIYEMVTGKLPFGGETPLDTMHSIAFDEVKPVTVVRRNLPPELHRIIYQCLRKKPQDRYSDTRELVTDLKNLKRDIESGIQRPLPPIDRYHQILEWIKSTIPFGTTGFIAAVITIILMVLLIFSNVHIILIAEIVVIGLLIYRYVKNRKSRMINKFTSEVSKYKEVKAIFIRENRITVVIDEAKASLYIRINSLIDMMNKKLYFGIPLEVSIRDDVPPEEFQKILQESGLVYVEDDVIKMTKSKT